MKKALLLLIVCFGIAGSVQAQSSILEKGQNGFGINGGFSSSEGASGINGGFGYSYSGVLDFGISVGRFNADPQILGDELNETRISPYISYLIIKQDDQIPVSFELNGAYSRHTLSGQVLRDYNLDLTGNSYSIGASLYNMIEASEAMRIQPSIGFNYITTEAKAEDDFETVSESTDGTQFSFGLSLIFQTSPNYIFAVTPSLGYRDDTATFGISLNMILPQN